MSKKSDRRAYNSTLRPVSKRKMGQPKKPHQRKGFRKPTLEEVQKKYGVVKASTLNPRSPSNPGWYNWAVEEVWNKREHKCEVCGHPLGDEPRPQPFVFSHLLPRNSYRKYKRDERNIVLKCLDHHNEWHDEGPDNLRRYRIWLKVVAMYDLLKREANNVP